MKKGPIITTNRNITPDAATQATQSTDDYNDPVEQWLIQDSLRAHDSLARIGAPVTIISAVALYFLAPKSVQLLTTAFFLVLFVVHISWFFPIKGGKDASRFKVTLFATIDRSLYMAGLAWIMITGAHDTEMDISNRIIGWIMYTFFGTFICDTSRSKPWLGIMGTVTHIAVAITVWITAGHSQLLAMVILIACTDVYTLTVTYKRRKNLESLARLTIDKANLLRQNESLKNQAIEAELKVASRIQSSLAATPKAIQVGHVSVTCYQEPYGILGGDWLATRKLADGTLVIAVADVSGKGIPAAMVVQSVQTLWAEALHSANFSAEVWMRRLNNSLITLGEKEPYTLTMGIITLDQNKLTYYSAGHVPMFILKGQAGGEKVDLVHGRGSLLGISEDLAISPRSIALPADGSYRILLGTDGVFDWPTRRNPQKLLQLVSRLKSEGPSALRDIPGHDDKILVVIEGIPKSQDWHTRDAA